MKKSVEPLFLMVLLLVSTCITCCLIPSVSSQSLPTVKVETSTAVATLGGALTVTISLTNVQNLYGVEVILNWNATVLQATNIETRLGVESFPDGILHESSSSPPLFIAEDNLTQSTGEYRLAVTSMAPAPPFTGSGNIVKITFNPINLGNSVLSLQSQLYDYPPADRDPRLSLPIQHTTQDSLITVTGSTNTPSPNPSPSDLPTTPTPTTPSNSPTQFPTLEPQEPNGGNELSVLIILPILLIAVIAFIILRKRKTAFFRKRAK